MENNDKALARPVGEIPMAEMERIATAIAKSNMFGMKSVDQALVLCLIAQAEGRHPVTVAQDYHVIQGRPSLRSEAILARFQLSGGQVEWVKSTALECKAIFTHERVEKPVPVEWDIQKAAKAGLSKKDNWVNYPDAMLRARVITEGVRRTWPAVFCGFMSVEEAMDMDDKLQSAPGRVSAADIGVSPAPAGTEPQNAATGTETASEAESESDDVIEGEFDEQEPLDMSSDPFNPRDERFPDKNAGGAGKSLWDEAMPPPETPDDEPPPKRRKINLRGTRDGSPDDRAKWLVAVANTDSKFFLSIANQRDGEGLIYPGPNGEEVPAGYTNDDVAAWIRENRDNLTSLSVALGYTKETK